MIKIVRTTKEEIAIAEAFFPKSYLESFCDKPNYTERIIGRRYLLNYTTLGNGLPQNNEQGAPIAYNGYNWSMSHLSGVVAVIADKYPVSIDISRLEERDTSLLGLWNLEEYGLFGTRDWLAFHSIWTAKECIIKLLGLQLDDIKGILVVSVEKKKFQIQNNIFDSRIVCLYGNISYDLYSKVCEDFILCIAEILPS